MQQAAPNPSRLTSNNFNPLTEVASPCTDWVTTEMSDVASVAVWGRFASSETRLAVLNRSNSMLTCMPSQLLNLPRVQSVAMAADPQSRSDADWGWHTAPTFFVCLRRKLPSIQLMRLRWYRCTWRRDVCRCARPFDHIFFAKKRRLNL